MLAARSRFAFAALAMLAAPLLAASPTFAVPSAGRITAENFEARAVRGPDADAGIGDYYLSNDVLCASVSAPDHEGAVSPLGGVLIDLGHCGRDDDQFVVLQPMLNFSQSAVVPVSHVETGEAEGRAWIETRAHFAGAELTTTYTLTEDAPEALHVVQRARRIEEGDAVFSIGQLLLHTSGQTPVFSSSQTLPDLSVGFEYPASDRSSLFSLLSALIESDLTVLVGADGMPPISYGLQRRHTIHLEGETRAPLDSFSVSGLHFTFLGALTNPPWMGARPACWGSRSSRSWTSTSRKSSRPPSRFTSATGTTSPRSPTGSFPKRRSCADGSTIQRPGSTSDAAERGMGWGPR